MILVFTCIALSCASLIWFLIRQANRAERVVPIEELAIDAIEADIRDSLEEKKREIAARQAERREARLSHLLEELYQCTAGVQWDLAAGKFEGPKHEAALQLVRSLHDVRAAIQIFESTEPRGPRA